MNDQDTMKTDQPAPIATGVPTTYVWLWSTRVRAKESDLDRSFEVLIFVGSVPKDPREWVGAPSYAGSFSAFTNGSAPDVVTEGYVHLNHALAKNDGVGTLDPHNVRPYLKDKLDWRVQLVDGTPVTIESLPSLEVVVVAVQLAMHDGELPVPVGEPVLHRDITSGRPGGAHPE
ncbi:hypothetical protein V8D89_006886 [Ganoderma adspersum]